VDAKTAYSGIESKLPLFYRSWWLDSVCPGTWDVSLLRSGDGQIQAVWPYAIERRLGMKLMRNPPLTPYLGPYDIQKVQCSEEVYSALECGLPQFAFQQWTGLPGIKHAPLYLSRSLPFIARRTYTIDLHLPEDLLWQHIHPKRRNAIRKAEQELQLGETFPDLQLFIDWQKAAFEQKGKQYPYSVSLMDRTMKASSQHKASLSLSARNVANELQAAIWLVFDERCMYYLLSGTPSRTHRGAVSLLLWHAIIIAKKMGLTTFDFEGSMDPDIAHFFKRFGGEEQQYEEVQISHSLLWKLKQKFLG
jgi:hypothetical protein